MSTTPTPKTVRAEARECSCGHVGINDSHATLAACNHCEWSGPSPKEDHCPECERDGTMCLACPECGGLYRLIAECDISIDRAALTQGAGAVEPVAEIIECQKMGQQTVREIDGRWRWLRLGDLLYAAPPAQQLQQAVAREREECAAICEDTVWTEDIDWWITATKRDVSSRSMLACAAAIRAKGTHD